MSKDNLATTPDDLLTITEAAKADNRSISTIYNNVRMGKITVHLIAGDSQAKVSLSEVRKVLKHVRPRFSAPTMRVIRHDEEPIVAPQEKADLFS